MIRDASDNAHSLDDVMRGLYQSDYKRGRGFTAADWWSAVSAAAGGKSFAAFSAKYIDGRAPFPFDSVLPLAGLRARAAMVPRLGVMTQLDSNGVMVAQVQEGSAASAAGVRAGDYLLTVGDVAVQDRSSARACEPNSARRSRAPRCRSRCGADRRRSRLPGKLRFGPGDPMVEADPSASAKAVQNSERDPEGDRPVETRGSLARSVALSHGGNSAADAAHGPDVCVTDRISFHTVLSASSSSIGSDSPATRVVSSE